jgi:hypothetical protein
MNEPDGPWREELHRFFGVDLTVMPGISVLTVRPSQFDTISWLLIR